MQGPGGSIELIPFRRHERVIRRQDARLKIVMRHAADEYRITDAVWPTERAGNTRYIESCRVEQINHALCRDGCIDLADPRKRCNRFNAADRSDMEHQS